MWISVSIDALAVVVMVTRCVFAPTSDTLVAYGPFREAAVSQHAIFFLDTYSASYDYYYAVIMSLKHTRNNTLVLIHIGINIFVYSTTLSFYCEAI